MSVLTSSIVFNASDTCCGRAPPERELTGDSPKLARTIFTDSRRVVESEVVGILFYKVKDKKEPPKGLPMGAQN
jgi:hypothetical protein